MRICLTVVSLTLSVWTLSAFGAEVTEALAQQAAQRWIHREKGFLKRTPGKPKSIVRHEQNGVGCYAVTMDDGSLVVTAADDEEEPVIAFSAGGRLVKDEKRPFWALLKRTLEGKAKRTLPAARRTRNRGEWGKLTAAVSKNYGTSSVSDVRVEPLVKSKWDQEDVGGQYCYNYYTPNNYCCGCVATAMAQVMRYHGAPTTSVAQATLWCSVGGRASNRTMKGGTYDWANMPYEPSSSSSETERQAIGKLTYDCGVSVNMEWAWDGSGAWGEEVAESLKNYFNYANAETFSYFDQTGTVTSEQRKRIICSNLDAKYPVILGISDYSGGHEIVADGYGYVGSTLYTHLNMGWSGEYDVWYNLPDIDAGGYEFDDVDQFTYNVFPDKTGEILSGRVVSSSGAAVAGKTVRALTNGVEVASTVTDAHGIYAFVLPGAVTYVVSTDLDAENVVSRAVTLGTSRSPTYSLEPTRDSVNLKNFNVSGMNIGNSCENDLTLEMQEEPSEDPSEEEDWESSAEAIKRAVNQCGVSYVLSGLVPWIVESDGVIRSGNIPNDAAQYSESVLQLIVRGEGTLSFDYEYCNDAYRGRTSIDGVDFTESGHKTYAFTGQDAHTVTLRTYKKYGSSGELPYMRISNLCWQPQVPFPTIDGTNVELTSVTNAVNSAQSAVLASEYATVDGNKLVYGGESISFPDYYRVTLSDPSDGKVTLSVSLDAEKARPTVDQQVETPFVRSDDAVSLAVGQVRGGLWYALSSADELDGGFAPIVSTWTKAGSDGEALTLTAPASGERCFYRILVSDLAPEK